MDIKEFINKTCHSRREYCGLEKCLFYEECVKDKYGDDCEPFVIRTLKAMIEEAEEEDENTVSLRPRTM